MENCLVTKLKSVISNDDLNYFDSVEVNVINPGKALDGNGRFNFIGATSIIGATIDADNKLNTITKSRIVVLKKSEITSLSINLNNNSSINKYSLEIDCDSCQYMVGINGSVTIQNLKLKGNLTRAFLGGRIIRFDLGLSDFSGLSDNFDNRGLVFGNYLADSSFKDLKEINISGDGTPKIEILPFINARREEGRYPASQSDSLSLEYSYLSLFMINGETINSSTKYIAWTANTVTFYDSSYNLLETKNV